MPSSATFAWARQPAARIGQTHHAISADRNRIGGGAAGSSVMTAPSKKAVAPLPKRRVTPGAGAGCGPVGSPAVIPGLRPFRPLLASGRQRLALHVAVEPQRPGCLL